MEPPENEIAAGTAITTVIARTDDDVVVALQRVEVYSAGVAFTVSIRKRTYAGPLFEKVHGFGPMGGDLAEKLALAVRFADGRQGSTDDYHGMAHVHPWNRVDDANPALVATGSGGTGHRFEVGYWLTPLPPDGPVTLTLTWPAAGIAETHVELDGAALRRAAERVVAPWSPKTDPQPFLRQP